jgi:hypothetical protein
MIGLDKEKAQTNAEECGDGRRNVGTDGGMWGRTEECGDGRDVHQFFFRLSGVKKSGTSRLSPYFGITPISPELPLM